MTSKKQLLDRVEKLEEAVRRLQAVRPVKPTPWPVPQLPEPWQRPKVWI